MAGSTRFQFSKIRVADVDKEFAFYSAALGRVEKFRYTSPEGEIPVDEIIMTSVDGAEQSLVLLHYIGQPVPAPGSCVLGFLVDDVDAAVAATAAAGGRVTKEPFDMPDMKIRVAFVEDPEGHTVELYANLAANSETSGGQREGRSRRTS
jgi:lactoylglutathione lyase